MDIGLFTSQNTTLITLPKEFRNQLWAEKFGKIQKTLREESDKLELIIDGTKCEWSDPLPLLSLIITILENKKKFSEIVFYVPAIDDTNGEQKKFLAFFIKEGFIDNLIKGGVKIIIRDIVNGQVMNSEYFKSIEEFEENLSFIDSTIFKAVVLNINELEISKTSVDDYVKENISNIRHRLENKIKNSNINQVQNRIELFLKETIENVKEHAYSKESKSKLIGIYIRYRIGLTNNSLSKEYEIKLRRAFNKESSKAIRLTKKFAETKNGFVEIFVIDAGMGITENYFFGKNKKLFRNAWRETIGLGRRSNISDSQKQTNFGGLYSLSRICQGYYLLARDNNEWIGDTLPIVGDNEKFHANRSYKTIDSKINIKGLALLARISWNEVSDNVKHWSQLENDNFDEIKLYKQTLSESRDVYIKYYKHQFNQLELKPFFIIDKRVNSERLDLQFDYLNNKKAYDFAFYLPIEDDTKNHIHSEIINKYSKLNNNIKSIIIGEITVWEASVYQFALEEANYPDQFFEKINRIILVTKRMSALVLEKNHKHRTFISDKKKSDEFIKSDFKDKFMPDRSLKNYSEWIKTHDSMLFWQHVKKVNLNQEYFLYEKIDWYQGNEDIGLNGYLNFAKTLTDPFCVKIYENVIERTLCLANENGCNYESIDVLTTKIATQFNSKFYNILKSNYTKILLGSVYVSGYSERSTEIKNINKESDFKIHFFYNQSIKNKEIKKDVLQLLLWPMKGESWFKENIGIESLQKKFERVGSSHVIAPGGWKYFPIPRYKPYNKKDKMFINEFDMKNPDIIYKSVYKQNPFLTYEDWQGKKGPVISIGHIDYENNHDLFKIDIPYIVGESILMGTGISHFLIGEFLYALGGTEKDILDQNNTRLINGVKDYIEEEYFNEKKENSIIVYPYHFNNEHIISLIKRSIDKKYHDRFFALFPLSKERSTSSFLTSPLTIEAIKKKIVTLTDSENRSVDAILFDDAIISGKTRKEIKHLLYNIGVSKIKTISIIERRRLPFSTSNPNSSKAFWRLDIPKLGKAENCYICSSISILKNFKNDVVSENVLERINTIQNYWNSSTPYNLKAIKLPPSKLNKDKTSIRKKFSVFYDKENDSYLQCGGENNLIEIYNSLGLTIYSSELHTMTSTDKTVIKFAEDHSIINEAKIELISCYLILFSNEINNVVREQLISKLFIITDKFEPSNYSSLALIALLNQGRDKLEILYNVVKDPQQSEIDVSNFDMLILCSYLAINSNSKFSTSKRSLRLLKKYKLLKDLYKQFHSEIYNDYGAIHDTPLQLMNKSEYLGAKSIAYEAQDSCDKLLFLIKEIPVWHSRQYQKNFYQKTESLVNLITSFKRKILPNSNTRDYINQIQEDLKNIFEGLKPLHFGFFARLGKDNGQLTFRNHISELLRGHEIKKDSKGIGIRLNEYINISSEFIDLEEGMVKKWIVFDKNIKNFITQVLSNVRHSYIKIKDPYNENEILTSFGWLNIEYCKDRVELKLTNSSKNSSREVEEKMNSKTKQARIDAKQLDTTLFY